MNWKRVNETSMSQPIAGALYVVKLPTGFYDFATYYKNDNGENYWSSDRHGVVEPVFYAVVTDPERGTAVMGDRVLL